MFSVAKSYIRSQISRGNFDVSSKLEFARLAKTIENVARLKEAGEVESQHQESANHLLARVTSLRSNGGI